MNRIRLALVLHNHQPIGNFDHVFEQAYQDSYLPFLDVFSRYDPLRIALHTSGPLMEWLDQRHPDYLDRLAELVATGRVEIVGGAFHEPILAMIPARDRLGQIRSYTRWLENRLGAKVRGMWMPERVWEQSFTRDLADAEIEYTVLDDFHFKNAGVEDSELAGYYLTEDEGRVRTYTITGQVLFASADRFINTFDYKEVIEKVSIDVSRAHFWDITAVDQG